MRAYFLHILSFLKSSLGAGFGLQADVCFSLLCMNIAMAGSRVSSIKLVQWEFFFLGPLMAVNKQCSKLQGLFTGFFPSVFSSDYTSGPTAE
jgi:hypothetical protein